MYIEHLVSDYWKPYIYIYIYTVLWVFNCNPYWPSVQEIWRCLLDDSGKKLWHQIYIYIYEWSFLGEILAVARPQGCTRIISYCLHSLECLLSLWMYWKAEAYTLGYSSRLYKQAFHYFICYLFILQENRSYDLVSCVCDTLGMEACQVVSFWLSQSGQLKNVSPLGHQVRQSSSLYGLYVSSGFS